MDELDSRRRRSGFADLVVDPHLSGKEDRCFRSISNPIAPGASRRLAWTSPVPLLRVQTPRLDRAVAGRNFRLHIDPCCSIFTVPLWSSPLADFLLWQIQQN